jgi:hypothetical protein
MGKMLSTAERANRITYFLKGDLERIQIQYIRAGAKLAQIRDEKLYRALKHETLEDYAEKRLGLGRSALYRYLQIYEWVRKDHPGWLAKHPRGLHPRAHRCLRPHVDRGAARGRAPRARDAEGARDAAQERARREAHAPRSSEIRFWRGQKGRSLRESARDADFRGRVKKSSRRTSAGK